LTFDDILESTRDEQERIQRELRVIDSTIRHTTAEVERLAQHNTQLNNHILLMQRKIDKIPARKVMEAYQKVQDTQGQLFVRQGRIEQLKSKQEQLKEYSGHLRKIIEAYDKEKEELAEDGEDEGDNVMMNIINAQENERLSLSIQMHDGPAQSLTNLVLQAEICERLFDKNPDQARQELTHLKEVVNNTFQKVREYIFDLRPMMLDDLGLAPTLRQYIRDLENKYDLSSELIVTGNEQRYSQYIEVTLFRVIQGLLKNVAEHAGATKATIRLTTLDDKVKVVVEDDGVGFDLEAGKTLAKKRRRMGIVAMEEQIHMLGGDIKIESEVGEGTNVSFWLPLEHQ